MRKILMIIIAILLAILGYITISKGIQIGKLQILSVGQIEEQNKSINTKIEEINTLIDVEYPKRISELKTASNNMKNAKSEYLKYTNLSTDEDLLAVMQQKSYTIEFLWAKLGTHARKEGVNLKFEIVSSSIGANNVNDLKFTIDGSYIAITNFIYAIENDTDLNFGVENFKLLPYKGEILQGTFYVKNITIEGNTLVQTTADMDEQQKTSNVNTINQTNTVENTTNQTNTVENTITQTNTTENQTTTEKVQNNVNTVQ